MRLPLFLSVGSLCLLGLIGGCLILAQDGFTTSNKRGDWQVFVPAPQAYVMAAIMFALSLIASVWLLQQVRATRTSYALCAVLYTVAAIGLTRVLPQILR